MKPPEYHTPDGQLCPECERECTIVPLLNDFDYGESHQGPGGVHYPADWGDPVSDCCDFFIEDAERWD